MKKEMKTFMGIGAISLAVILIVLTMTCFSILTFVSADSEYKLSEKAATAAENYYQADAEANERIAEIGKKRKDKNFRDFLSKKGYNVTISQNQYIITFHVPVDEMKKLRVKACVSPSQISIWEWKTVPAVKGESQL